MTGNKKIYIIASAVLLAAVIAVICIISLTNRSEKPQPQPSLQTASPEPSPTVEVTPEPEKTPEPTAEPTASPEVKKYTFDIYAGEGGSAYPCGVIEIEHGEDIGVLIQSDEGYEIDKVTFDGKNVRLLDAFSFTYDVPFVTQDHVFSVEFKRVEEPEPTPEETPEPTPEITPEPTPEPTRPVSNSDI